MVFAKRYLKDINTFPPSENKSWGNESIIIQLAGLKFRYSGLAMTQAQQIRDRFQGFIVEDVSDQETVVDIHYYRVAKSLFLEVDFRGGHYTFDQDYQPEQLSLAGQYVMARIPFTGQQSSSVWTATSETAYFPFIFENLFRVIAAYQLMAAGGLIMHSACIAKNGHACLALGRSGAGKSTLSKLAQDCGWEVLSDDMNALFRRDGQWVVERLPFAGDLGQTPVRSNIYPLAAVYLLSKSNNNDVRAVSKGRMLATAFACTPTINGDPLLFNDVIQRLETLISENQTGILEFSPKGTVLNLLN